MYNDDNIAHVMFQVHGKQVSCLSFEIREEKQWKRRLTLHEQPNISQWKFNYSLVTEHKLVLSFDYHTDAATIVNQSCWLYFGAVEGAKGITRNTGVKVFGIAGTEDVPLLFYGSFYQLRLENSCTVRLSFVIEIKSLLKSLLHNR
ncbi:hypothetical protein WN51_05706 [Melipona quadrifasciata]|uniref:Uncharacterized protein n=1 Tax=Melipona quadrifasciata TaxID=166423 RepID=A0A0M9ADN9_9HYME|nr:hypothetical protein WN51_05706 [Melipona quadrifasciata]